MKKRIFSLLLVIAMLVTVLPVNVFAAGCDHEALDYSHYSGSQHRAWCDSCRQYIYGTCDKNGFAPDPWGDGHYAACSVCGRYSTLDTRLDHTYGSMTTGSEYGSNYHSATCTACGYSTGKQYCSNYYTVEHDEYEHWLECSVCGTEGAKSTHTKSLSANGDGTHTTACTYYSYSYGGCDWEDTDDCTLGKAEEYGNRHRQYCSVCKGYTYGDHDFGSSYVKGEDWSGYYHQRTCQDCGATEKTYCSNTAVAKQSGNLCWKECSVCGQKLTGEKTHAPSYYLSGSDGSETHSGTCSNCGGTATEPCPYDGVYSFSSGEIDAEKGHRNFCTECRTYSAYEAHTGLTYKYYGVNLSGKMQHEVTCAECEGVWYEECDLSYTYTDKAHTATCKKCEKVVTKDHKIDLTAEATSANVITVSKACKENCGYAKTCGTLTVTASDTTYDGTAKPASVANTVNTGSSYEDGYSIFYYKQSGSGWSMLGSSAPKDAGTYKAEISSNVDYTVKASVTYEIKPADLDNFVTVTAENTEFTYNRYNYTTKDYQTVYHSIKLNVTDTLPYYQNAKVEYSEDDGATWSSTNPAFTDVGTHTVKYRISADDNFDTIEGSATVTIKPADLPFDSLIGYRGPYDGSYHFSFGYVKNESDGFGGSYTWYTYAPWTYSYYDSLVYDFSWNGGSDTLTLDKDDGAWDVYQVIRNHPEFKYQNVEKVDYSVGSTQGLPVTVTITDTAGNYNTKTFTYYIQIGRGYAYSEDVTYPYDAQPHDLPVYGSASSNVWWSTDGGETWVDDAPTFVNVGRHQVMWKTTIDSDGSGNDTNKFGSKENFSGTNYVTITAATLTVTPDDASVTYGDDGSGIVGSGYTVEGFKGADNFELDETNIAYTSPDYQQFDDVGTERTVEISGLKMPEGNENYQIAYAAGKLNILPKEIGIDWSNLVLAYNGSAQAPTATASGTVNGDEIALTVHGAQTDVGRYMATVTGITGEKAGNYKLPANCDVDYEIVKAVAEAPAVTAKDETIKGKKDGGIVGLTTEMEYSADGGETWTKVTDPAVELAPGTYLVRYAETDTSLPSKTAEVTIKEGKYLTVTLPEGEGYTTSTEEKADEQTYNDTFTFEVEIKDGYSKGENFKVTANGQELTPNEDGSYTITGIVEDVEVKVEGVVDNTTPAGTITVSTHKWKEFVKNITFNIFFKNSQTVTITAEDTGSGIKSIEYIACEAVLTEDYVKAIAASEWKPYTAPFEIDPDAKVIVYAKITDKAGNVKFISSDGMVFDGTAPVFNGVQDGGEYNEETKFTVTDDNLDKVTVDGVEVKPDENGNYTLPMDNKEHVIVATDKSGNKTEITVTLRDIYNVTLPKGDGYETKGEPTVKDGDDYTFEVEIKDGYAKGDDFKVTVNGQEIKPNADGKYVVENVTSDLEIVVSGVEKVKAPAPTTETPKTGDEGLFLPLMLFMLSGIACVSLIAFKKKFRF